MIRPSPSDSSVDFFFSNRVEVLYEFLKASLFGPHTTPFMHRMLVVYGPAMKTWLTFRMAQDPELQVATGIEIIYLNQAFEHLLKLSGGTFGYYLPTLTELALAIERECMVVVREFPQLTAEAQSDWEPLIHYFKLPTGGLSASERFSLKNERRLISLSLHLARLFQDYGRHAVQMVASWEAGEGKGWQPRLWRSLFGEKTGWSYPIRLLQQGGKFSFPLEVHFFSISFITASEFAFLHRLSSHIPVHYYWLSPCALFWSDIRSDRERASLHAFLEKKRGMSAFQVEQLDEFLRDRNPLLANFGRLGREMATRIEESPAQTRAHYLLPASAEVLGIDLPEEVALMPGFSSLSLLHAVQTDLLTLRNPEGTPPVELDEETSLQLHVAPNLRREIEILYHNLLGLIAHDPSIQPGDIIVMAPQITVYLPYIQSLFGTEGSPLDFQVLDLGLQTQSEIVRGFLELLDLSESRWDASRLLQLFEHSSFQRRHQLSTIDCSAIREWVAQVGIFWGNDVPHRNEWLNRRHCRRGMAEETEVGTWDYGISRLLWGLMAVADASSGEWWDLHPHPAIDFSQGELLGKWIRLLRSLRDDLSPLYDRSEMTIGEWMDYLNCLLDHYFLVDGEESQSIRDYDDLKEQFKTLGAAAHFFQGARFSFTSIKAHLLFLLEHRGMTHREEHLHAVRFCSLVPLRSIPAKVIAILGLHEGAFPRTEHRSSLNLMLAPGAPDSCPSSIDYDRYLFLEALHAASQHLLLSYQGYGRYDHKELLPSLVVEELFSYLDASYTIRGRTISESCIHHHPPDAFDRGYFEGRRGWYNFSCSDHRIAQMEEKGKTAPHAFLRQFVSQACSLSTVIRDRSSLDLRHLSSVARNPIKFHLNQVLDIYLQSREDRTLQGEENLVVAPLDKYWLKHDSLRQPIESLLRRADKEGKLPFGLFKTVAERCVKADTEAVQERLCKHGAMGLPVFQIEFCASCLTPVQVDPIRWRFPAVSLDYGEGYRVFVVGKLPHVTSKGLIALSKGTVADAWKAWPQFLLYCHAVRLSSEKWAPRLLLVESAESKEAFFDDPIPSLKAFVEYYALCLQHFSPLLPEWLPCLLQGDASGLEEKMQQLFTENFSSHGDREVRWILNKHCLPDATVAIENWQPHADRVAGDFIRCWYPKIQVHID